MRREVISYDSDPGRERIFGIVSLFLDSPISIVAPAGGAIVTRPTNNAGGLEGGVTNGEDVIAVAFMKPLSTLAKGLDSVDLETGEPARSAYERSDVAAVSACGVIAEGMLAFVLADALLELTGGDRLEDVTERLARHRERVRRYPR